MNRSSFLRVPESTRPVHPFTSWVDSTSSNMSDRLKSVLSHTDTFLCWQGLTLVHGVVATSTIEFHCSWWFSHITPDDKLVNRMTERQITSFTNQTNTCFLLPSSFPDSRFYTLCWAWSEPAAHLFVKAVWLMATNQWPMTKRFLWGVMEQVPWVYWLLLHQSLEQSSGIWVVAQSWWRC